MKTYRGSPAAARNYVESGRARADDYYLAEGIGIAERYAATPSTGVSRLASLSGDSYESWVAGCDPDTGAPKGRLRNDDNAVRFVEIVVNGPKTWSLAAELHPDISAAFDAAQDRAAIQIIGWLAQHATTRVGPRGAQVQVPVQHLEAVTVRHHTSRAGDPHRHLHLQINARVFAEDRWRGLHTIGVRDSLDALNGIGHAAVMTDPRFRAALAAHGFTVDPESGEVTQLAKFVGPFSARAAQIGRHIDRYDADWRAEHPGQEPGPALRRAWDARAWAEARPDKVVPRDGAELTQRWVTELHELGYRDAPTVVPIGAAQVGHVDRDRAAGEVLSRLAARRSAWNAADVRGEVELLIARRNIVTEAAVRSELAEDLTDRALNECVPLLDRVGVPEHIRALTSRRVLAVEADLAARLATRAHRPFTGRSTAPSTAVAAVHPDALADLDPAQRKVVAALAGDRQWVVVEGAAGAGKTTTLAATRAAIDAGGHRLVVLTPTLKAAEVAARQLGTRAFSVAWLAHQHGYRWHPDGTWTRLTPGETAPDTGAVYRGPSEPARLRTGDLVLVDEAGMLDQDTARALLTIVDEHHARLALVGDRHQLPAVGRGGVLDLAVRWADPHAYLMLDTVHRFSRVTAGPAGVAVRVADDDYAELSLAMRAGTDPDQVFDALLARGQISVHPSDTERLSALAAATADAVLGGNPTVVAADTREQVAALNSAVRERLTAAGRVDDRHVTITAAGQRIGVGDRVATRRNNTDLDVANRDSWTVTAITPDGQVNVTGARGHRILPAGYVHDQVELAYASTVHAAQGETATTAHLLLGEHTTAASAYVAMTRGRDTNLAHLVADSIDDARVQWVATFTRDRADLGPAHAAELAAAEAARYAPLRPLEQVLTELHRAWTLEHDHTQELNRLEHTRDDLSQVIALTRARDATVPALKQTYDHAFLAAEAAGAHAARAEAQVRAHADRISEQLTHEWDSQRAPAREAAQVVREGPGRLVQRRWAHNRAADELANWSTRWQPYLPAMPTRTQDIVAFASWADDTSRIHDAFEQHARNIAEHARPDCAAAHAAANATAHSRDHAANAYHDATARYRRALSRYGNLPRQQDPAAFLKELDDTIPAMRSRVDAARARVNALLAEPALRVLPADQLSAEHDRWHTDRDTAARERQSRAALRHSAYLGRQPLDTPHPSPSRPTPQHTRGISR